MSAQDFDEWVLGKRHKFGLELDADKQRLQHELDTERMRVAEAARRAAALAQELEAAKRRAARADATAASPAAPDAVGTDATHTTFS